MGAPAALPRLHRDAAYWQPQPPQPPLQPPLLPLPSRPDAVASALALYDAVVRALLAAACVPVLAATNGTLAAAPLRVLDVGCGGGSLDVAVVRAHLTEAALPRAHAMQYVGVDAALPPHMSAPVGTPRGGSVSVLAIDASGAAVAACVGPTNDVVLCAMVEHAAAGAGATAVDEHAAATRVLRLVGRALHPSGGLGFVIVPSAERLGPLLRAAAPMSVRVGPLDAQLDVASLPPFGDDVARDGTLQGAEPPPRIEWAAGGAWEAAWGARGGGGLLLTDALVDAALASNATLGSDAPLRVASVPLTAVATWLGFGAPSSQPLAADAAARRALADRLLSMLAATGAPLPSAAAWGLLGALKLCIIAPSRSAASSPSIDAWVRSLLAVC